MDSYPLESLLSVRHFREEEAKRTVRYAELAVREAEEAVLAQKKALEEFRVWRVQEEERRYDAIMNTVMDTRELDSFKAGLVALAAMEAEREEDIRRAEKKAEESRKALDNAREAAKLALKNTAKIQTHKDIWAEEAKKDAEHREDLELEEFRPISRLGAEAEGEDA
ncbi:type III secretion system stalk subunit SctO [Mailhella sp.]|uniref:type III secretion system stalk subunit SctO n=1 Tax=Mailhella sp. TaxID=1981029 RepID=UPI0040636853